MWACSEKSEAGHHMIAHPPPGEGERVSRSLNLLGLALLINASLLLGSPRAFGQITSSITLAWNPASSSSIAGYRVYYGVNSQIYTNVVQVGNVTNATLSGLNPGVKYFIAATTYNSIGLESPFSGEITYTPAASQAPSVALTAPASGSIYTAPATINLAASVSTNGNTITKVQFFNGSTLLAEDAAPPYAFAWSGVGSGSYTLMAKVVYVSGTNPPAVSTSTVATISVIGAPVLTAQPVNQTVSPGGGAQFNVAAIGTSPLRYQWQFNRAGIAGATLTSLILTNVQPANAGNYTVVVTNSVGSVTSAIAVLTVPLAPSITSQPANQTNVAGTTATFSVSAGGGTPLSYQWQFNSANIAGASATRLTLNNVQSGNGGNYRVVVTNSTGSATSGVAVLSVLTPPAITSQPTNQTVVTGSLVRLNVAANGTAPLTFRWSYNGTRLADSGIYAGTATPTLYVTNSQPTNGGGYSVVITNVAGAVTSSVAMLSITVPGGCVSPPMGFAGWWPGDGNANDIAGTNNGTLRGGATATAAGKVGQAFNFDGTNNYVSIPDSPLLRPTNFTIEAWVKFSSLDSAGLGGSPPGDQYVVFKQNTRSSDFEGFDLSKTRVAGGDVFRFLVTSATGQTAEVDSATLLTPGVWYHVAAVRGYNYVQIYVNGRLERQGSVSFPQDYGALPVYLGSSGQSFWDHKLKGALDEVSLYKRALSSNEVANIYSAGAAGKCKGGPITLFVSESVDLANGSATSVSSVNQAVEPQTEVVVSLPVRQPSIASVVLQNGTSLITWSADIGSIYRVQFTDILGSTAWKDVVPDVLATGPTASVIDYPGKSSQRFYRIVLVK